MTLLHIMHFLKLQNGNSMITKFKKDSTILGAIIGLLLPVISFAVLYALFFLINKIVILDSFVTNNKIMLVAIFFNLIPLRYYFVKLKFELSGRGILLVTFIYIVAYFSIF